ncbi:MAG: MBL fold metallo-hydrolase [Candidatus Harrisonbacteria bacterium]|nr:MBL fold metallo-hydrolase [Candidatus Harrisonbacteria bacterium]
MKNNQYFYSSLLILAATNGFIWYVILFNNGAENLELWFFDVGQGDSQMINLPGDVQILIDGGRSPKVLTELAKALAPQDRYIDLIIVTHPDFDHFGGLIDVLRTYEVGAVITNGRSGKATAWGDFEKIVKEKEIKTLISREGDKIVYETAVISVLSPSRTPSPEKAINDSGIVLLLERGGLRALYTADIGFDVENQLARKYDLSAQILKVAHHGSKYSSNNEFLRGVNPSISVIGVGKNSYGHPTNAALNRLADVGSQIFRTDLNGTIKAIFDGLKLKIYYN